MVKSVNFECALAQCVLLILTLQMFKSVFIVLDMGIVWMVNVSAIKGIEGLIVRLNSAWETVVMGERKLVFVRRSIL
jgi:hypothetical protein